MNIHKYADPSKIEQEKDAWRKAAIRKHGENDYILDDMTALSYYLNNIFHIMPDDRLLQPSLPIL